VTAGEKIAVTAKPLRSEAEVRRRISRLQREATTNLRKSERRGASARRRVTRTLQRQRDQGLRRFKRNRREAERRAKSTVKSTKDELAQRADGAQSAADELGRRVRSEASGIV
jgi:hypothetical protein